jgi:hypothetical protein
MAFNKALFCEFSLMIGQFWFAAKFGAIGFGNYTAIICAFDNAFAFILCKRREKR